VEVDQHIDERSVQLGGVERRREIKKGEGILVVGNAAGKRGVEDGKKKKNGVDQDGPNWEHTRHYGKGRGAMKGERQI